MSSAPRSQITRSWPMTFGFLAAGVACAALSFYLFRTIVEGPVSFGFAAIPAVAALVFLYMAVGGAGTCACPLCGAAISGVSTGANDGVCCPGCHKYLEGTGGALWATDPARVADVPLFTSPLPESFTFPGPDGLAGDRAARGNEQVGIADQDAAGEQPAAAACCVCGAPATRRHPVSLQMTNASSAVTASAGVTSSTRLTVQVPHCDAHADGALLAGTPSKPRIRFRSYPYLRAFCQRNGTTPG